MRDCCYCWRRHPDSSSRRRLQTPAPTPVAPTPTPAAPAPAPAAPAAPVDANAATLAERERSKEITKVCATAKTSGLKAEDADRICSEHIDWRNERRCLQDCGARCSREKARRRRVRMPNGPASQTLRFRRTNETRGAAGIQASLWHRSGARELVAKAAKEVSRARVGSRGCR